MKLEKNVMVMKMLPADGDDLIKVPVNKIMALQSFAWQINDVMLPYFSTVVCK